MAAPFDFLVIGAGTGGYVAAIRAAQLGLSTAVVERQAVLGGTCLNVGCIPTKTLLEHAHALKVVQRAEDWGIRLGQAVAPTIDLARVVARQTQVVSGLTRGVEYLFKKHGIEWLRGTARIVGPGQVEVSSDDGTRRIAARELLVATGSAPRAIPGIAIDGRRIITSDHAIALDRVPGSLAVIGSGAVGAEFASIFRSFGSEVTLVEQLPRLVPAEEEVVSAELARAFRKQGMAVRTSTRVVGADVDGDQVLLRLAPEGSDAPEAVRVDALLVAVGRRPVTDGLGLESLGVALDRGYVRVDEAFRTNVAGISAVGDVISLGDRRHPQLAHVSSAEGIAVAERVAGREVRPLDYDQVPSCTYCDPEIGSVGLSEAEAVRRGHTVRIGTFPFSALGRARIAGDTAGFVRVVGDATDDQLLGVHIIGPRATELVAEAVVALRLESTVEELMRAVHAHPTMAEAVAEAAHAVHGAAIHI